ncbi:MAG TPA: twin-arginine translocation signal domain-containing protein, partial [Candidatus Cybelea sp.]|nr:twin-arginine translocation signal domain-containing protein [Candidatus Cybelea sp.]
MINEFTTTRRQFLKTSALAGSALLAPAILPAKARAAEDGPTLKVGLIGCGGRGTGAAGEAMGADKNVVLTAMADVFEDKLNASLDTLRQQAPEKVKVEPDHRFVGLDAYQKLLDSGVDVVIL